MLDKRKKFHPAANHVKNGRWGQGEIGERVVGCHEENGDKMFDDFSGCGCEFLVVGFWSMRWLWKEEGTEAILECLENTRVGCMIGVSSRRARADESRDEEEVPGSEGGGRARPTLDCIFRC